MITFSDMQRIRSNQGRTLSEIRKADSEMVINATFTEDPAYKRVYILGPEKGWHYTDAKYSKHATQSILKDDVDYYMQFRPHEHYPVGTYLFIPNDDGPEIGFAVDNPVDPFEDRLFDDLFKEGKLWMIVNRNNANIFVRYNILPCNYDFKWITPVDGEREVLHVYGMFRMANSYTSGVWRGDVSVSLDTVGSAWLPDIYYIFKQKYKNYNLDDTRYLALDDRLMITNNKIHPQCWRVSKIDENEPSGLLKITFKRDTFDEYRDNPELMLCNYYDRTGDIEVYPLDIDKSFPDLSNQFDIYNAKITTSNNGKIQVVKDSIVTSEALNRGQQYYYIAQIQNREDLTFVWNLDIDSSYLNPDNPEEDKEYLIGLMDLDLVDDNTIRISPRRVKALEGKKFKLTAQDRNNEYKSVIELEVL